MNVASNVQIPWIAQRAAASVVLNLSASCASLYGAGGVASAYAARCGFGLDLYLPLLYLVGPVLALIGRKVGFYWSDAEGTMLMTPIARAFSIIAFGVLVGSILAVIFGPVYANARG
ncbi:MAG: hypothetical protein JSS66_11330 [Armatimonadetes bacterium]|nr:hypothetical protein [Armatimonadota bacterium]